MHGNSASDFYINNVDTMITDHDQERIASLKLNHPREAKKTFIDNAEVKSIKKNLL